jgi:hypothetical protein
MSAIRQLFGLLIAGMLLVTEHEANARSLSEARAPRAEVVSDYKAYRHLVDRETAVIYRSYRATIDPQGLRGKLHGYDLDHILSVKDCYRTGMTVQACSSPTNLQVIPAYENRSMGCKSTGCRARL